MLDLKELKKISKNIESNGVSDSIIEELETGEIVTLVERAINHQLDSESIKYVTGILNEVYHQNGKVFVTDTTYDELYEINLKYNGETLSGESTVGRMRYKHKYPQLRGTIGKCYFVSEADRDKGSGRDKDKKTYEGVLRNWNTTSGDAIKRKPKGRMSLKVDGVSGVLEIGKDSRVIQALKRGEIIDGVAYGHEINILKGVSIGNDLDDIVPCGHKVEIYMTYPKYEEYIKRYGHYDSPRAAVTSITNSEEVDPEKLYFLRLMDLEFWNDKTNTSILPSSDTLIQDAAFDIEDLNDLEEIRRGIDKLYKVSLDNGIPADGVVIRVMDEETQEILGRKDYINAFEIAYKFPAPEHATILEDVYFSMGIGGSFTPMAKVKTVRTELGNVSDISLGSLGRLKELNLRIGQPVTVTHSTIPYMKTDGKEYQGEEITYITHCPKCNTELKYEKSRLFCPNDTCEGRMMGKILKFCVGVGIENIGEKTVEDFYNAGLVKEPADLYKLDINIVKDLPGYDKKSATKIKASIDEKKQLHIDIALGSLSIPFVGRRLFAKMFQHKGVQAMMEMFRDADFQAVASIKGIGKSAVNTLNVWASKNSNIVMMKNLLDVIDIKDVKTSVSSHSVLFTKVRDKEFADFLEGQGISVVDSYSKNVDVVIYGAESNKTEKARADGKLTLTLQQAYETYGYK